MCANIEIFPDKPRVWFSLASWTCWFGAGNRHVAPLEPVGAGISQHCVTLNRPDHGVDAGGFGQNEESCPGLKLHLHPFS